MDSAAWRRGLAQAGRRRPELDLRAERRGAHTVLTAQFVTYPFHLTRPFRLDPLRPEVATLYMQSASGGLYADEDLNAAVAVGPGAALHLTTQASTMVLGPAGKTARMRVRLAVGAGGFLAYGPDPLILFPGSAPDTELAVDLAPGAGAVLNDGFLLHDPQGLGAAPQSFRSVTEVRIGGRPILVDRQRVAGADLAAPGGPLNGYRVAGSALLLGLGAALSPEALGERLGASGVLAGVTALPAGCGLGVRVLAHDGASFQTAMTAVFAAAFTARFGVEPTPRRK
ncbi:urease accessory protein UreD [Chelatococcus reniformis]|uniref:urease accessory protein UreD n=1 Tax=Chelatococcus reniformis TaxID=1494448 RepID=UPI00166998E0|nr:urease accessory protein UreD [Chelatococcus reniformis]